MKNMKEVVILRFRKVHDENVTTEISTRDLIDKEQVFTNMLINPFKEGERFISYDLENPKNNLTLGTISVIGEGVHKGKFGVTSEIDASITYFKYRIAKAILHEEKTDTKIVANAKGRSKGLPAETPSSINYLRLEIVEQPEDWDEKL